MRYSQTVKELTRFAILLFNKRQTGFFPGLYFEKIQYIYREITLVRGDSRRDFHHAGTLILSVVAKFLLLYVLTVPFQG